MDRRYGQFHISRDLINNEPIMVQIILATVLVVKAEYRIENDSIEYTALSYNFDKLTLGQFAPLYIPNYNLETRQFINWEKE